MKIGFLSLSLVFVFNISSFAGTEPTHYLCDGIYAHKTDSGEWKVFRDAKDALATLPGTTAHEALLAQYCEDDPHPKIHLHK